MPHTVEYRSLFIADDLPEAEALLEQIMEAELAIVCPTDSSRLRTCTHCHGTLLNPPADTSEPAASAEQDLATWQPGDPCAVCTDTEHPGQELPCAREHVAGATIHPDTQWHTQTERRTLTLLTSIHAALDTNDPATARSLVCEALSDLTPIHDLVPRD